MVTRYLSSPLLFLYMGKNKRRPVSRQPKQVTPRQLPDVAYKLKQALEFHRRGQLAQARPLYNEILNTVPNHFDALHLLGVIEAQHGHNEAAVRLIGQALQIHPNSASAHSNIGNALRNLKRSADALASYDRALAIKPDYAEALYNRGLALQNLERPEDALASYDRALAIRPDYAEALMDRGHVLQDLKRHEEALASYDRALAIKPRYAEALMNRGNVLHDLERYDDALASHERALAIKPDHAEALYNRGLALHALMRPEDELASYGRALAIKPDYVEAHLNRGNVLHDLKRYDEALASYDRALAIRPDYADALSNRGNVLRDLQRHEDAAREFERLLSMKPDHDYARGRLLNSRMHCCAWHAFDRNAELIADDVRNGKRAASPFSFLAVSGSTSDQLRCSRIYVSDRFPASARAVWQGGRYSHEKIRVAYLSAELREHATSYLIAGLVELHDRRRFEVFGISTAPAAASQMRTRLRGAFDRFLDVATIRSDREVASLLRNLEIDILVDLNGYFGGARTGILALRPAPIQVNYLGYPGTTGAEFIDYIIADRFVIPAEHHAYYTEKVVYLPDTYQVNDSRRPDVERASSRAAMGLPETGFVFCCFNNNYKITPKVFDVWMRLLERVDDSVLWLLQDNAAAARNLRREAERRGVAAWRLIFAARMKQDEHLARQRLADLFLDTLPVNAHTTASDALWAGLPVVTSLGSAFAGRVAASLLNAVGIPELATHSLDEYEALALRLATNPDLLSAIKVKLSVNRMTHPLFNTDRFRAHIEAAFVTMWERYQRGEPPASFAVPPIG